MPSRNVQTNRSVPVLAHGSPLRPCYAEGWYRRGRDPGLQPRVVAAKKNGPTAMSILTRFWRRLDGPVHPDDTAVLARIDHPFNLEFPPPAFGGDIDRAPVVLLSANGGWCDAATVEREMATFGGAGGYIDYIRSPRPLALHEQNGWLRAQFYSTYIADGRMATANAIAYRSPKTKQISAPLKRALPSLAVARRWLKDELLPAARAGQKLVVAHRYGFWGIRPGDGLGGNVLFSSIPRGKTLPNELRINITGWLESRQP
jgi:hypothetical protein